MAPSPRSVFGCQRYRSPQQPRHSGLPNHTAARLRALACWLAPLPLASIRLFGLKPLVHALTHRARLLASAFRSVVFAQVRISALNTALTAVYLLVIVPWMGVHLPLTKP